MPPERPLICHQCPSFCDAPWAPPNSDTNATHSTIPTEPPHFCQCPSFCDAPWAPLISHQCPSFWYAPERPLHFSPMPLICDSPLSSVHSQWHLIFHQCPSSCDAPWEPLTRIAFLHQCPSFWDAPAHRLSAPHSGLISKKCPLFYDAPERALISPMPLILWHPLSPPHSSPMPLILRQYLFLLPVLTTQCHVVVNNCYLWPLLSQRERLWHCHAATSPSPTTLALHRRVRGG